MKKRWKLFGNFMKKHYLSLAKQKQQNNMGKQEVTLKTKYTKFIITCKGDAKHTVTTDKPITVGEALKAFSNSVAAVGVIDLKNK